MYYRNVFGRQSDSSILKLPPFSLPKADNLKVEFYYYIKSSGYQALEMYEKIGDEQMQQIWRTEAVPPELEEVWAYACLDMTKLLSGISILNIRMIIR